VLGCAAGVVLWGLSPLAAQVPVKVHRIGYLTMRASLADFDRAFLESLAALGYVDGRTIAIDFRFADSDLERAERMVGELIALKPDVLVVGGPASRVAARATSTIPIVMTAVADPVGQGLVASLRHPGGNLTGVTLQSTELAQKRLQILRDIVPSISRVALLGMRSGTVGDPTRRDGTSPLVAEVERAAGLAGVALVSRLVREAGELPEAFMHFRRARSQALIVQVAPVTYDNRRTILALAAEQRLPALYETRNYVDDGGLMSYGPDLIEVNRRAATYVDRILRGAKPGELAVDQPGRFELVVNLRTAAALGIAVPQALLMRADDVIR
jgi:putative ABC transport system substrate-binding protein